MFMTGGEEMDLVTFARNAIFTLNKKKQNQTV